MKEICIISGKKYEKNYLKEMEDIRIFIIDEAFEKQEELIHIHNKNMDYYKGEI